MAMYIIYAGLEYDAKVNLLLGFSRVATFNVVLDITSS